MRGQSRSDSAGIVAQKCVLVDKCAFFKHSEKFYSKIMIIYLNFTSDARKDKKVDLKKKKNLIIYESFF